MRSVSLFLVFVIAAAAHPAYAQSLPKECKELAASGPHNAVAQAFENSHVVALLGPLGVDGYKIEKIWKGEADGALKFKNRPTYFENNLIFAKRSRPFGPLTDIYGPCFNADMSIVGIIETRFGAGTLEPKAIIDSQYFFLIISALFAIAVLSLIGMSFLSWLTSRLGKSSESAES